jgi:uncharacterized membrane protein YuzA (DUF378 family)
MKELVKINLYRALLYIIVLGALNWGLVGIFDFDLVKSFGNLFGYKAGDMISRFIYITVAMSALVLIVQRDTRLPFLGMTVVPQPMTNYKPTGELVSKVVKDLPPNVKVVYWAAQSSDKVVDNPTDAYGDYSNQGVTTTDADGVATFEVRKPTSYKIPYYYNPFVGTLESHIHYRYWTSAGMASRIYTIDINK